MLRVPKPKSEPISEEQLAGWKLLERFLGLLDKSGDGIALDRREQHGLRELDRRTYFGLFLFGLFNPVVASMRALCAATRLERVQQTFDREGPVAISGFSDAQQVFAAEILQPVMQELLSQSLARNLPDRKIGRISPEMLHVFDSTLWKVIPRMGWAKWRYQNVEQRAVRLHVKLRLADLQPDLTEIGGGKTCERAAMRRMLKPGEFYLGDRYYGGDHGLFQELDELGCGYVLRLNNATTLEVVENHPVPPEAAAQGVISDAMMKIGARGAGGIRRVVILQRTGMKESLILVTSEPFEDLSALEVTGLYRHRWEVEMFFRWLKCLVPCRHWFAESREGVRIQIYLVLIKALLLAELTGRKPNKRMMELLHWHQMGWASDAELTALLAAEEAARQRRRAKKKS
jgi:Transposase DDE domain